MRSPLSRSSLGPNSQYSRLPLVAQFHQGGVVQILETGGVQHAQVGGQLDHAQLLGQLVESPGGQPAAFLKRDPCVPDLRHVDEQGFVIP